MAGGLSRSNEDLLEFTCSHVPTPSPSAQHSSPAWSAARWWWWWAGPFTRVSDRTESHYGPTPCCFALRDANAGRLQCLKSCGSAWHWDLTGSLPRKKTPRECRRPQMNTCLTIGLQASASSHVSLRTTSSYSSWKWKQDSSHPAEKNK